MKTSMQRRLRRAHLQPTIPWPLYEELRRSGLTPTGREPGPEGFPCILPTKQVVYLLPTARNPQWAATTSPSSTVSPLFHAPPPCSSSGAPSHMRGFPRRGGDDDSDTESVSTLQSTFSSSAASFVSFDSNELDDLHVDDLDLAMCGFSFLEHHDHEHLSAEDTSPPNSSEVFLGADTAPHVDAPATHDHAARPSKSPLVHTDGNSDAARARAEDAVRALRRAICEGYRRLNDRKRQTRSLRFQNPVLDDSDDTRLQDQPTRDLDLPTSPA